jgi:hypothetical protein
MHNIEVFKAEHLRRRGKRLLKKTPHANGMP